MLSIKRLLQLIAITVFIGVAYLLLTIDHNTSNLEGKNYFIDVPLQLITNNIPVNSNNENYLLVGSSKDKSETAIHENILATLSSMKLSFKSVKSLTQSDLDSKPTLIFCVAKVSSCADMGLIGNFISSGGKVLFAAGIPEAYYDSYLNPVWGIIEKGNRKSVSDFLISDGFLPYSGVDLDFKGSNASTILKLGPNSKTYVRSHENLPIIYSNDFNGNKTVVINGTFLQDKFASGLFTASLGVLKGDLLYPIIGTKTIFLDAFPPIANVDDIRSSALYGRSSEAFLRDILWPQLLANQSQHGLKYTASILSILPETYDANLINKRLFTYIFREIISRKGEMIMSGDHSKNISLDQIQAQKAIAFLKENFKNYLVNGYSVLFGKPSLETLNSVTKIFDNSKIIVGVLNGDPKTQYTQDFGERDNYLYFPSVSNGFTEKNGALFDFLSSLTSKGVVSHSFNIESLLKATSANSSWDGVKSDYENLDTDFFEKTPWLKPATVSEAGNYVKAYSRLKMNITTGSNEYKVYCDNFMVNQSFYMRSEKNIKEVLGGSFKKISAVYYLINATSPNFSVVFEQNTIGNGAFFLTYSQLNVIISM